MTRQETVSAIEKLLFDAYVSSARIDELMMPVKQELGKDVLVHDWTKGPGHTTIPGWKKQDRES